MGDIHSLAGISGLSFTFEMQTDVLASYRSKRQSNTKDRMSPSRPVAKRRRRTSVESKPDDRDNIHQLWGPIQVEVVDCGDTFVDLILEVDGNIDEGHGLRHSLEFLADAFRQNRLYSLRVEETDGLYHGDRLSPENTIFVKPAFPWQLPCLCVVASDDPSVAEIIWVHPRARRLGLGTELVRRLGIRTARRILPESLPFWTANGIPEVK